MPYKLSEPIQVDETRVVRQETIAAEVTAYRVVRFTVDLDKDRLEIVAVAEDATGRRVETAPYGLRLSDQPEAFAVIESADAGVSLRDLIAQRLYALLERRGLVPIAGTVE